MRPTRSRLATLALLVAAVVLLLPAALSRKRRTVEEPAVVAAEPCPAPEEEGVADIGGDGGARGRSVPKKPGPAQKRPPCDKRAREINGACYYSADPNVFSPPCDAPTFEHDGRCYHMVIITERPSTSIQQ